MSVLMTSDLIETTIMAPVGASILEEDTQVIQRPGWYQILTPSIKDVSLNEVMLSRVSRSESDQRIEEVFSVYQDHDLPFKWCMGPMSSPEFLEGKIKSRAKDSWDYRGMVVHTNQTALCIEGVTVERVSKRNFEAFLDVFLIGWDLEKFRDRAQKKFKTIVQENSIYPYYLAMKSGEPVGSAGTVIRKDCGYLVGAVVLPQFRGCGAYRALIHSRLTDLAKMGFQYAVTHAREATSAPILEKIGFETVFRAKIYKF